MCVEVETQLLTPVIVRKFGAEKFKPFLVPHEVIVALTEVPMRLFEGDRRLMIRDNFVGMTNGGWASFDEATMALQGLKEKALQEKKPYTAETVFVTIDTDHAKVEFPKKPNFKA